jgi:hypothetical protein
MAKEQVQWSSPSPLWPQAAGATDINMRRSLLRQPAILRFATDTFMNDFASLLETDPARLPELLVSPETWRGPTVGPQPIVPVPLFARTLNRLGLAAAREKNAALVPGGKGASSLIATGTTSPQIKLKLYQPVHQRYYLVTSSLVCGRVGLPDHTINPGRHERATFVLRRMFPPGPLDLKEPLPEIDPDAWEEYAFVSTPSGNVWQRIPKDDPSKSEQLVTREEQLPMFPMNFTEDDGRKRRVLAGLIPVGKREAYMGAAYQKQTGDPEPVDEIPPPPDPRMHLFWSQVTEPWKKLLEQASASNNLTSGSPIPTTLGDPPALPKPLPLSSQASTLRAVREQIQTGSWYIVLDFANLLKKQTPRVWRLLNGQQPDASEPPFNSDETALVNAISGTTFDLSQAPALVQGTLYGPTQVKGSLRDALTAVMVGEIEKNLEAVKTSYDRTKNPLDPLWPNFLFPLADPALAAPLPNLIIDVVDKDKAVDKEKRRVGELADLIEQALPDTPAAEVPTNPLISQQPMDMREGWFVVRCVFERPECGPIDPPMLSAPTRAFQMAGFFDPDAPARPLRIALPLDTSPAGLRKFDKNTAFMISDMLCGQIDRVKGMTLADLVLSVLPWPFHKDLSVPDGGSCTDDKKVEVGMICSLSIPIITICALLMLMIIVSLLDIIFRWTPFFLFCFPLPKFKAKTSS